MFAAMCSRGIDRGLVQILQIQTSWHLIPSNIAHCCSQHGPATRLLTTEWPGILIPLPKTFALIGEYCPSQCVNGSHHQADRTAEKIKTGSIPNTDSLHFLQVTEELC
jgi:hypothetical protein